MEGPEGSRGHAWTMDIPIQEKAPVESVLPDPEHSGPHFCNESVTEKVLPESMGRCLSLNPLCCVRPSVEAGVDNKNLKLFWQPCREPVCQCIKQPGHEEAEDIKNNEFVTPAFKFLAVATSSKDIVRVPFPVKPHCLW